MILLRVGLLSLAVGFALGAPQASHAQGIPELDSTRLAPPTSTGQFLDHWTSDEGAGGEQTIFLRNRSTDRAITITSWEVYECYLVAGTICRRHDKGPTIKPGKTARLVTIRGFRGSTQGYSYRYRFTQQWTDELTAATGD